MIQKIAFLLAVLCGLSYATPTTSQQVHIIRVREKPPLTQWSCSKHEKVEYARTCLARRRSL